MSTPVPLLALALALCGLILLVALIWHRRWLELALVVLVGCALALHLERGRRSPDRIGKLVAEVVNADRSISLHIQVGPGAAVWCSSVFSVEATPAGEPARESADWFVDLHPTERSDAKPLNADAAGRAVVTLSASQVESAPNFTVRIRFNGNDQGTTRLDPATPSPAEEKHAESAEPEPHATPDDFVGLARLLAAEVRADSPPGEDAAGLRFDLFPLAPVEPAFPLEDADWRRIFAACSVDWPEGSFVYQVIRAHANFLSVRNTEANLRHIRRVLDALGNDQSRAARLLDTQGPAEETHAESAENAEPNPHAEDAESAAPAQP